MSKFKLGDRVKATIESIVGENPIWTGEIAEIVTRETQYGTNQWYYTTVDGEPGVLRHAKEDELSNE